mgnify:CR=1 FL=1
MFTILEEVRKLLEEKEKYKINSKEYKNLETKLIKLIYNTVLDFADEKDIEKDFLLKQIQEGFESFYDPEDYCIDVCYNAGFDFGTIRIYFSEEDKNEDEFIYFTSENEEFEIPVDLAEAVLWNEVETEEDGEEVTYSYEVFEMDNEHIKDCLKLLTTEEDSFATAFFTALFEYELNK